MGEWSVEARSASVATDYRLESEFIAAQESTPSATGRTFSDELLELSRSHRFGKH
jgi:hypothetical protein